MPDPDSQDILWYNPDPRAIIPLDQFVVTRSLRRSLQNRGYKVTFNQAFREVMAGCADRPDTWINAEFFSVYGKLHDEGDAHSVEVWFDSELVGGLYGVSLGAAFFAESKFHTARDASKVALYHLISHMKKQQMQLLEVQFITPHLQSLGAITIPAEEYQRKLQTALVSGAKFQ